MFDAVGTTIVPEPGIPAAYAAAGQMHGSQLTPEEVRARFDRAFARQEAIDEAAGQTTSELRERQRWEAIVAEVFQESFTPDLFQFLWNYFGEPANWRVCDDVPQTWEQLQRHGYQMCVASNFDARLANVCRGLPPLDRCQHVFVSSLLQVRKPSRAFFESVQARLQLPPEQILMVGDGRVNDYQAAREAGWPAVLVQRSANKYGVPQDAAEPRPDSAGHDTPEGVAAPGWIVKSLEELPALLGIAGPGKAKRS